MEIIEDFTAIVICALVPIAIVWIVFATIRNGENKRAEILMKAIESNPSIDIERLAQLLGKTRKVGRQVFTGRLLKGCIFSLVGLGLLLVRLLNSGAEHQNLPVFAVICLAIGVAYMIVCWITRKDLNEQR